MVRVIEIGKPKREKRYFQTVCPWCESKIVFEQDDMWCDDWVNEVYRVECPVCRSKAHFHCTLPESPKVIKEDGAEYNIPNQRYAREVDKVIFETAHIDTSKSGLQVLIDAKKREDEEVMKNE